ncbi:MAG TPA: Ig-like domain-containing protein [Fimbriimonas sp.]|nr:Ig-like domain-containing protein [Fimbriimonas sp.]
MLALTACAGNDNGSPNQQPPPNITVTISPPTPTVAIGNTIKFSASVDGTSDQKVIWSASAGSITPAGVFTPPKTIGDVTVTATSEVSSSAAASVLVSVTSASKVQISINPPVATLGLGGVLQFTATVTGSSNKGVTWATNNGTITDTGFFTAPDRLATVNVLARSNADPTVTASVQVNVVDSGPLVTISPAGATLAVNAQQQFTASVTNTTNTRVTWSATGGTITQDGLFTAGTTPGTFHVTATSQADNTRSATVLVLIQPVTVSVTPSTLTMVEGTQAQFTAKVIGTSNTSVTWSASDGIIDSTGLFTAPMTAETVTITATSKADNTTKGTATVTVQASTDDVYNFENGIPTVWSPQLSATAPAGQKFLGQLATNQTATLSLAGLTQHTSLQITFDLYVIGGWDANKPFTVSVDGTTQFSQTFSNITGTNQSFPDGGSHDPGFGSASQNSLGYTFTPPILFNDTIYHITLNVPHTASTTTIVYKSDLDGTIAQMAWGLDNVEVKAVP